MKHLVLLFAALVTAPVAAQAPPVIGGDAFDPSKVVGSDACKKCHAGEIDQWSRTRHCLTIDTLHRKPEADAIAERLGLRNVKRNDVCVQCHYTQREERGRARIDSGVSCESCHGPAQGWLELHAEYGPGVTRETEAPDARQRRRLASIAAGMNNPSNLYLIAKQCLDCHTTPNEQLVDVGLHPAGSPEFSLVAWSQGTVRHNFVRSNGTVNEPSPLARVRVMHVVGLMTDLEYSLRAVAKATSAGTFAKTAAARAASRKAALWELQRKLNDPLVQPAMEAVSKLELKLGNSEAILAAADAVGDAAYAFAERADGARLAAVDEFLPPPGSYK